MIIEEYLKNRVDDQIKWHSEKSQCNRSYYELFSTISLVCTAISPPAIYFSKTCGIILSLIVAISVGVNNIYKFHDKWQIYRITAELLQREKCYF